LAPVSVGAYVLVQTEVGKAAAVTAALASFPGVETANTVIGPYDVIVKMTGETMDDVARTFQDGIRSIEGITRTLTCEIVHL
jgi:DNA-binding Lrp family transcriptional regulator